ncbi:MAG: hypothetical protein ABI406_05595 [Ktedonobacteraceae bacterium]
MPIFRHAETMDMPPLCQQLQNLLIPIKQSPLCSPRGDDTG